MAGKEKRVGGCFSFLFAGQAGFILVWVPGAAFHLPMHRSAHTDILQKAICLFKQILHKKTGDPLSGAIFSDISEAA